MMHETGKTRRRTVRADRMQWVAILAYLALIFLSVLWEGWLAPAQGVPPGFWLTIKTVPLLLPLFGPLHGRPYTYAWASMLVLPYFIEGVVLSYPLRASRLMLHAALPYALIETLLCLVFIVSATFYARQRADALRTPPVS